MGMIKHLITGETLYVSKKFVSGWEMDNHLNTVFLSNNTQPLPIEEKDRRFLVLNPTKALEGKLYEAVMQEINSELLSCLCGSEQFTPFDNAHLSLLSCLCGSEQ